MILSVGLACEVRVDEREHGRRTVGGGSQERRVLCKPAVPLESADLSQERSDVEGGGQSVLSCAVCLSGQTLNSWQVRVPASTS